MPGLRMRMPMIRVAIVRNKGLVSLIAIGLVLLGAVVAFFHALWDRQNSSAGSVREDALWATYQTDRETGKLILALHDLLDGRTGGTLDEVSRRFDILYSRHEVMEEADFPGKFRSDRKLHDLTEDIGGRLHRLLPLFDRMAATKRAEPAEIETALAEVSALRSATEALLVATNHVQLDLQVEDREAVSRIHVWLAGTVLALMVAVGAVIVMIWRQLGQNEISRFRLQRLSEELAQSAAAAEAGNKAKSAFLATMSHEIRTPLNGIIGTAELMSSGRLDDEQIDQLSTIRQCSDALIALINDILDFSKLESGHIDLERRRVDLAEVIDGVVEMLSPRAEAKGLDFVASYPLAAYETDPTRLRQVLINLVGNAVKFTDYGAVMIRAREVIGLDGGRRLRIEVEDTGVGIPAAAIGRLFTEFSQADASIGRRFGGTGLGLAISRRIVEAMNGRIGVESVEGRGTTFWIDVPVIAVASAGPAEPLPGVGLTAMPQAMSSPVRAALARDLRALGAEIVPNWRSGVASDLVIVDVAGWEARRGGPEAIDPVAAVVFGFGARTHAGEVSAVVEGAMTTRRLARILTHRVAGTTPSSTFDNGRRSPREIRFTGHVLVVEDNPVNRKVAVGILTRMGLTTETVVDGLQAVERLAHGGVDLVLMDMQMPVMDGLEATRRIRAGDTASATIPIVGLTANAFASDRVACFEAGMNDFVIKPVTRDRLQAALASHLPEAATAEPPTKSTRAPASDTAALRTAPGVLDPAHRRHLVEQIGEEGVAELTDVFVADATALLDELAAAHAAGDAGAVRRTLHTLTGAAANVGCSGVVAAIAAIREAGVLECPDLVGRLGAEILRAQAVLAAEGGTRSPAAAAAREAAA
ncbi:MAG: ATP-binding protein [Siculibacillus sp.]|nr:ATP-binding protein [Siculibacillus sp.]